MPEGRVAESMPQRKRSEECSELHSPSWRLAVLYPEPVGDDWSLGQAELLLRMPAICGTIEELFLAGVLYPRGICENDEFELHGKRRKGDGIVLYSSTLRDVAYQLLVRTSMCDQHDQNDVHHMQGGVRWLTYRICWISTAGRPYAS